MRDYGKVHTSFWTSANIRDLSEDGRALALYLLTCPHGTIAGVFRLPDGYACEDLQWDAERVKSTLSELFRNGFATRCEVTKWVWVTKHFEWNPPENPNQKKAAAKMAAQIPDLCSWKTDFIGKCGEFLGIEPAVKPPTFKPLGNPSETLFEPVTVTVTVTGEEDSADLLAKSPPASPTVELLPPDPPVVSIPLNNNTEFGVTQPMIDEWVQAYPAVDVVQELREMRTWSAANPTQRKTSRGVTAFICRWLGKEQDRGGARLGYGERKHGGSSDWTTEAT